MQLANKAMSQFPDLLTFILKIGKTIFERSGAQETVKDVQSGQLNVFNVPLRPETAAVKKVGS